MAGRKVRDEAEARALLAALAASGAPLAEWSRARGIDGRSLHAWRNNLRLGPRPAFIELVVAPPPAAPPPAAPPPPPAPRLGRYLLHFDALTVEVDEQFDAGTLRRLLDALAC